MSVRVPASLPRKRKSVDLTYKEVTGVVVHTARLFLFFQKYTYRGRYYVHTSHMETPERS